MTEIIIFEARSPADLGFTNIVLTAERADHISTGHRDLGMLPNQLIRAAIEGTTQVYDSHIAGRYEFLSNNVRTRGGRPAVVIVEREKEAGKIITASWKDKVNKPIIWDSDNELYSNFDSDSDVLYVSRGPAVVSYAVEDESDPDFWFRYSDDDASHTGVTVFNAQEHARTRRDRLVRRISEFIGLADTQIAGRIERLFPRGVA
jgi:hypothetical protein